MVFSFPFQLSYTDGREQVSGSALQNQSQGKEHGISLPPPFQCQLHGTFSQHFKLSTAFVFLKYVLASPCFVSDGWLSEVVNIHFTVEFSVPIFEAATIFLQNTGQAILLNLQHIHKQVLSSSCNFSTFSLWTKTHKRLIILVHKCFNSFQRVYEL